MVDDWGSAWRTLYMRDNKLLKYNYYYNMAGGPIMTYQIIYRMGNSNGEDNGFYWQFKMVTPTP